MSTTETVQVASVVPRDLADSLREVAAENDRSTAAEIRLAIRAWVDTHNKRKAVA